MARQAGKNTWERKWWAVEETADPTTLPMWQRDFRYGFQVLKRTMVESRRKGEKAFWKVRITDIKEAGYKVEMLNSGLPGWLPRTQEGPNRLELGAEVMAECVACPQKRVDGEKKHKPWPTEPRLYKARPIFSHWLWLEQQRSIEKAKELTAGTIVTGWVYRLCGKGLIVTLEGEHQPKGMLAMQDISRQMSSHSYVEKMFPPGTAIKCYVIHSDTYNGRITLSTKEFEDDEHVGWMLSFPERCFAKADEAVRRYHEKRDAYIAYLQR